MAVTTNKTSGLRMAVKSISTYTADLGSMVSMLNAILASIVAVSSPTIRECCVLPSNAWGKQKDP